MTDQTNPYVGPRPFEFAHRDYFFGRESEARRLAALLVAQRAILLYAASGIGKSSLLQAGVIPRLLDRGYRIIGTARVSGKADPGDTTGNIFSYNMLQQLDAIEGADANGGCPSSLEAYLTSLCAANPGETLTCVLILDQLEELFTYYTDRWRDRESFFKELSDALKACSKGDSVLQQPPGALYGKCVLRIVLSIREEYLAHLEPFMDILPELRQARFRLQSLSREHALQAIVRPARRAGRMFDSEFARFIVNQLIKLPCSHGMADADADSVEPVQLQVVCADMWEALPAACTVIKRDSLPAAWTIEAGLERFYEKAIAFALGRPFAPALTGYLAGALQVARSAGERIEWFVTGRRGLSESKLRRWFNEKLITPFQTRAPVLEGTHSLEIPRLVIDRLKQKYLLRTERRANADWLEIAHDRLIEPIFRSNRDWLARHRARTLTSVSCAVVLLGLFSSALTIYYSGDQLNNVNRLMQPQASRMLLRHHPDLWLLTTAYETSKKADGMLASQSPRLNIGDVITREAELISYLRHERPVVSVGVTGSSFVVTTSDLQQTQWVFAGEHPKLNKHQRPPKELAECVGRDAAKWFNTAALVKRKDGLHLCRGGSDTLVVGGDGDEPQLHAYALDPTASFVVAGGCLQSPNCDFDTLGVWEVSSRTFHQIPWPEPLDQGRQAASSSPSREIHGRRVVALAAGPQAVAVVTCDLLSKADTDCRPYGVRIYDLTAGYGQSKEVAQFDLGTDQITGLALAPRWVAVASQNQRDIDGGLIRVMSLALRDKRQASGWIPDGTKHFRTPNGGARSLAFHPDGDKLIAGGPDKYAMVWDLKRSPLESTEVFSTSAACGQDTNCPSVAPNSAQLSKDSKLLAVANTTVRPVGTTPDPEAKCMVLYAAKHEGQGFERKQDWPCAQAPMVFGAARGWRQVSMSQDGEVIAASGSPFNSMRPATPFAVSARSATGSYDPIRVGSQISADPASVAVAPSGKLIVWGADQGRAYLWDVSEVAPAAKETLLEPLSPECVRLRSSSFTMNRVTAISFSADERRLVVADSEGCIAIYERLAGSNTWSRKWQYDTQGMSIAASSFSPDGRFLAAANISGKLLVWSLDEDDIQAPEEINTKIIWVSTIAWRDGGAGTQLLAMNARWGPVGMWFVRRGVNPRLTVRSVLPNTWLQPRGTASLAATQNGDVYALSSGGQLSKIGFFKTPAEASTQFEDFACRLAGASLHADKREWIEDVWNVLSRFDAGSSWLGSPVNTMTRAEADLVYRAWDWAAERCPSPVIAESGTPTNVARRLQRTLAVSHREAF